MTESVLESFIARGVTSKPPARCCITGPQWVGANYFKRFYVPLIDDKLNNSDVCFILGDADGVDSLAQQYLAARRAFDRVTVYIKNGKTAKLADPRFSVNDSAASYPARDALMAESCSSVIAVLPQFGNLTTGATLPIYKHHIGENAPNVATLTVSDADINASGGSHIALLLNNRSVEAFPKMRTTAETALATALRDKMLAEYIVQLLRVYSEPEDKGLTKIVATLYEIWYAEPTEGTSHLRSLLSHLITEHETQTKGPTVEDATM